MENKKRKYYVIAAIVLVVLLVVGGSYAYWTTTQTQTDENIVGTTCLSLIFEDTVAQNTGVKLSNTYPISDEEGMSSEGYQFTITNRCSGYVAYTVNLESLILANNNANRIALSNIDAVLDSNPVKLITEYETGTQVLANNVADDARALTDGVLAPNGQSGYTVTYRLRLWLDKYAPSTQMNKSYSGKITISAYNTTAPAPSGTLATTYITNLAANDDTLYYDGTVDNNLRYVGANPNNYVSFNGELWRIIGVMNNVSGGTVGGATATRVKIMRAEPLADNMEWNDTSASGVSNNLLKNENKIVKLNELDTANASSVQTTTYNANNWEHATLNEYLNTTYYNSLSNKNLIDTATWYLGYPTDTDVPTSGWYTGERSNNVYEGNPTSVTSNIALMYPSDYGYSTNYIASGAATGAATGTGGSDAYGAGCLSVNGIIYAGSTIYCARGSWMWTTDHSTYTEWLLSSNSSNNNYATYLSSSGYIYYGVAGYNYTDVELAVRPALYLKSTVQITGGAGTSSNPYTLSV